MATVAALDGASCSLALCFYSGTTSAGGVGAKSTIAVSKGAAGGATALGYTTCPNQGGKLQAQRLHAASISAVIRSCGRQLLNLRAPAALPEKLEAGIAAVNTLVDGDLPVETEEPIVEQLGTSPMAKVTFKLQKEIHFGQVFNVAGSSAELGQWDIGAVIPLVWSEDHVWTADVVVPVGQTVEYKFVLTGNRGELDWQPGENRTFEIKDAGDLVVSGAWDASEASPEGADEEPTAAAQGGSWNGVAPGADVVEGIVTLVGMATAKVEETVDDQLPKVTEKSDDIENGKPGGEDQASELPAVDAIVATALASGEDDADGNDV